MTTLMQPTREALGLPASSTVERAEAVPPARGRRRAAAGATGRTGPAAPEGVSA
jgi:hypothetical protein